MNIVLILLLFCGLYCFWVTHKNQLTTPKSQAFHGDIEKLTLDNRDYRRVLSTTKNMQLVLMSLLPGEEIGLEIHPNTSQFVRVEKGYGVALIDNAQYPLQDGSVVVVPPNASHNVINTSRSERLQLYTIYTPPEHSPNTLQKLRPDHDHNH